MQSILLVDDDAEIASTLTESLTKSGFQVVSARAVSEAIAKLSRQQFNAVLVDLHLGQGNGEEVIKYMRTRDALNSKTPAVVISAFVDTPVVMRLRQSVQGVLVKPFLPSALAEKIRGLVPMQRQEQEPEKAARSV